MVPKLDHLVYASTYRDGGSKSASFKTVDGRDYEVWLVCRWSMIVPMPDNFNAALYTFFDEDGSNDIPKFEKLAPIPFQSAEEAELLTELNRILPQEIGKSREEEYEHIAEDLAGLIDAIPKRRTV